MQHRTVVCWFVIPWELVVTMAKYFFLSLRGDFKRTE